ncbi:MAG: hydroxysqualene dehydroxylase HpnE [Betaproteobacteria bacterium]
MGNGLRVAIIGGGWAGLAAGVELSAAGARVTVFESSRQLGGRARRVEVGGHLLDNGQHILIGAYHETLRLMRKVGAKPEHTLKRLPLELNHPGSSFRLQLPRLPVPLHLAFGLLAAQGCTLGEKISAVRFMRALQSHGYQLPNDCSVAELLDRHQQQGNLRRLMWEALCIAALNTSAENASAKIFANVLRDSLGGVAADTDLLLPAVDLGATFPDPAAQFIRAHGGEIHLSTRIDEIPSSLELQGERFDHILLAVAAPHAEKILRQHIETTPISEMLGGYSYEPIATVYLAFPPGLQPPCAMLGLETGSAGRIGQWAFDRGALCGTPGIISFVLSAHGVWEGLNNEALVSALHRELQDVLDKPLPQPLWQQVIREQRATFSCRPNLPRPTARTPLTGLWLAGDYVCANYPATLEGAVRSGIHAAAEILKH